jgi:hypothetical protein
VILGRHPWADPEWSFSSENGRSARRSVRLPGRCSAGAEQSIRAGRARRQSPLGTGKFPPCWNECALASSARPRAIIGWSHRERSWSATSIGLPRRSRRLDRRSSVRRRSAWSPATSGSVGASLPRTSASQIASSQRSPRMSAVSVALACPSVKIEEITSHTAPMRSVSVPRLGGTKGIRAAADLRPGASESTPHRLLGHQERSCDLWSRESGDDP